MKNFLLLVLVFNGLTMSFAQNPVIEGDLMLCPDTNGTAIIVNQNYDTYQWYSKYWFTDDQFVPIEGATQESFIYDWYTYDQSLFKVVVTLGDETLESNVIQIDSYAWSALVVISDLNEFVYTNMDNGNFMLCPGGSFNNSVNSPYDANIQWFKDGNPITGANETSYVITEPGAYYVQGAPSFCSASVSSNQDFPLIVEADTNCTLANDSFTSPKKSLVLYPNPVLNTLTVDNQTDSHIMAYSVLDASGKVLMTKDAIKNAVMSIDVSDLSSGIYILISQSDSGKLFEKFIKK